MPAAKAAGNDQANRYRTIQPFENDGRFFREEAHIVVVHNGIGLA
jgi:hypothetical protein